MLVSIHIPKTAGTSFGLCLLKQFESSIQLDYDRRLFHEDLVLDRKRAAMEQALQLRQEDFRNVACIHGHFLGLKYGILAEQMPCSFVTWLRDPVERLLSHYYFWKETYDPAKTTCLYRRMTEENWSFERFAMYEDFQNFQSQFLWGLPLASFEFVGITEEYKRDFEWFTRRYFGKSVEAQRVNSTKSKPGIHTLDPGLRRAIEEYHSVDMALYQAAVARRRRETPAQTESRALAWISATEPSVTALHAPSLGSLRIS